MCTIALGRLGSQLCGHKVAKEDVATTLLAREECVPEPAPTDR